MLLYPESSCKFVTVTRGGMDGLIAVLAIDGDDKYFELQGLMSLLETSSNNAHQKVIIQAIDAIQDIQSFEEVPEFEGSIPTQGSLF